MINEVGLKGREMETLFAAGEGVDTTRWCKHDTMWVLGIYGCAVSGGTLFWPVSLGLSGFWPMLFLSLLAFPMTFVTYLALARFVLTGSTRDGREGNILDATNEHLGAKWGKALTLIYFITVFPSMAICTIAITNTILDFTTSQLHLHALSRWIVAPGAVLALMVLVRFGTNFIVKTMGYIVFPFILAIVLVGFMAVPHWNGSMMSTAVDFGGASGLVSSTWKALPLVVFAFSFTAITSSFVVHQKRYYGDQAPRKVFQVMFVAVALVVVTLLFFSWSSIFALSPAELVAAKNSNLTVLSFLARKFESPVMAYASQAIVFTAVIKSFLAHYIATEEAARGFGRTGLGVSEATLHSKGFGRLVAAMVFVVTTAAAIFNPNVLTLISVAIVPISVCVVYFIPLYAIRRVPALRKYRGRVTNVFIAIIGVICLISGFVSLAAELAH
jgi:serine transporter